MQQHKTYYSILHAASVGVMGKHYQNARMVFHSKSLSLKNVWMMMVLGSYLYLRRHKEDALVVPYNPEIALLWGAAHNVQKVSRHGFEMYLAKYISKPEPSLSIQLPENASAPQRYLRTRVIGSVEALEVLLGFHQYQMTRQVIFFAN